MTPPSTIRDPEAGGRVTEWAWLPFPLFLMATALCVTLNPQGVFQPWWLLVTLGFVFSGGISILVAYLAAMSYLAGASGSVLLLGSGMLIFGMSSTVGGIFSDLQDPNVGLALFDIAVVFAGACHLASAMWANASSRLTPRRQPSLLDPVLAYGGVLLCIWGILVALRAQALPPFFVQGQGPTPIRYVVLGVAILLFALAAVQFWALSRRAERPFFLWYGLGLGLIAAGLTAVYFQKAVGTPLNWVGRSAQYLGGVYILMAIWTVVRDRSIPLGKTLALLFGEAETPYRPLVEAARDAILSLDQDGRILFWNEGAIRLLGYTPAEAFGANLMALVAPRGSEERLRTAWNGLPRTPEGQLVGSPLEAEVAAKGGRTFWAELTFYARPTARGNLTVGIVRDISERKQAEATLRQANTELDARVQERTAALAQQTAELQQQAKILDVAHVIVRDPGSRIVLWNTGAERLYGYTAAEAVGQVSHVLFRTAFPVGQEAVEATLQTKGEWDGELIHTAKDGRRIVVASHQVLHRNAEGTPEAILEVNNDITVQKQLEESLRESQERLALAAHAAQIGLFDWNMQTGELLWTPEHERLFGYAVTTTTTSTTTRHVYRDWVDRVHPDDLPGVEERIRRAIADRTQYRGTYRVVWPDGSVHWITDIGHTSYDAAGRPTKMLGVVMEVTEQKQAEQRLADALAKLDLHIENTPLAVIEWGPDFRLVRWSRGAERLFGWSANEVLGKRLDEFRWVHDEDAAQVACVAAGLVDGSTPQSVSANRNYRKDGSVVYCEWYNSALKDEAGQLRSVLSLVLDVTDRRCAEDALQIVARFPDENPDPILRVTRDGTILYANRNSEPLLKTWDCQVGQRLPSSWCARVAEACDQGRVDEVEVTCEAGRVYSCILTPIVQAGYLNIYSRDITERKAAEAALRRAHAELEQRVQERTAELSQTVEALTAEVARRTRAEDALRERSQQLRALASELTLAEQRERRRVAEVLHGDLQQLLVGAKLLIVPLTKTPNPEVREVGREAYEQIDQALLCSRSLIEELSPSVLRREGLIPALEWLAQWTQERHRLTVILRVDDSVMKIIDSETTVLLFQSIRELLLNAVKHAQVETAQVEVAQRDDQVQVIVSDAGVGFDPTQFRGGFGLFSIRERVELLGGRMEITSAPGQGSRCTIWVPAQRARDAS